MLGPVDHVAERRNPIFENEWKHDGGRQQTERCDYSGEHIRLSVAA